MRVVRDFTLPLSGDIPLSLPATARPLWIGLKGDIPTVSVLLDQEAECLKHSLRVIASESPFDETSFSSDYVGSFSTGGIVYHVVVLRG